MLKAMSFFLDPVSGSGCESDFIGSLYGLPLKIFDSLFLTQFTSNPRQTLSQ